VTGGLHQVKTTTSPVVMAKHVTYFSDMSYSEWCPPSDCVILLQCLL